MLTCLQASPTDVWELLEHLSLNQAPIRVEIENSLEHFVSHVAIKEGWVVIVRPPRPTLDVSPGRHIRLRLPGAERRDLRLEVALSHKALGQGVAAFVCKPSRQQAPTRRQYDRYSVRRYRNVRLKMGATRFRVLDISLSGCKFLLNAWGSQRPIALGVPIYYAHLIVESQMTIQLGKLIPRSHYHRLVGCEFEVAPDSESSRALGVLVAALERKSTPVMPSEPELPPAPSSEPAEPDLSHVPFRPPFPRWTSGPP